MDENKLSIDIGVFNEAVGRVSRAMMSRINAARTPEEKRAAISLGDITGANVNAQPESTWWGIFSEPLLDTLIEKEMADITMLPMAPGGMRLNRLSWVRTALRLTGSAHPGENPTLNSKLIVPKMMHGYFVIDEAGLASMMYRFTRKQFMNDREMAEMAENALFIRAFVYAVLASLINIAWNGDTGGVDGLNMFDGWLKDMKTGGIPITTAGVDLLGTIFPDLWSAAGLDQRHLDMPDICIYTSRLMAQKYKRDVLANRLDERGTYDPVTKELYFLNARVIPVTDFPTARNGSNVLAALTRKINLVCGIVDEPLKIDTDRILSSRSREFSSPIYANVGVSEGGAAAYWMPA